MSHAPTIKRIRLHESSAGRRFDCLMPLSGRPLMALGRLTVLRRLIVLRRLMTFGRPIILARLIVRGRLVILRRLMFAGRLMALCHFSTVSVIAVGAGGIMAASTGPSATAEPRPQGPAFAEDPAVPSGPEPSWGASSRLAASGPLASPSGPVQSSAAPSGPVPSAAVESGDDPSACAPASAEAASSESPPCPAGSLMPGADRGAPLAAGFPGTARLAFAGLTARPARLPLRLRPDLPAPS